MRSFICVGSRALPFMVLGIGCYGWSCSRDIIVVGCAASWRRRHRRRRRRTLISLDSNFCPESFGR